MINFKPSNVPITRCESALRRSNASTIWNKTIGWTFTDRFSADILEKGWNVVLSLSLWQAVYDRLCVLVQMHEVAIDAYWRHLVPFFCGFYWKFFFWMVETTQFQYYVPKKIFENYPSNSKITTYWILWSINSSACFTHSLFKKAANIIYTCNLSSQVYNPARSYLNWKWNRFGLKMHVKSKPEFEQIILYIYFLF